MRPLRILTIGHPYALHALRRLPNEMARIGGHQWEVLTVGPSYYHGSPRYGDLEPAHLIVEPGEQSHVAGMPMYLTRNIHFAVWGDALRRLMREPFDLVHCWDEPFNPAASQIALLTRPETAFCFFTAQNLKKTYPPPFNFFERFTLSRADGWVAAGDLVRDTLISQNLYAEKPHRVVGMGVDVELFKPDPAARTDVRSSLHWADDDIPIIGYLGRFTEAKGVPILLRTLDRLQTPWRALFMGSGELEQKIAEWSSAYPGRVAIRRNLGHVDVSRHLVACDLLCVPSQTTAVWKEQFGRVLVEAFACGVPVVASDSGEIPAVVGPCAVVVPERDEQRWFQELDGMVRDATKRARYGQLGLERARTRFAWAVIARQHLSFFQDLIERRRGAVLRSSERSASIVE